VGRKAYRNALPQFVAEVLLPLGPLLADLYLGRMTPTRKMRPAFQLFVK
jgi:hypothetical protein